MLLSRGRQRRRLVEARVGADFHCDGPRSYETPAQSSVLTPEEKPGYSGPDLQASIVRIVGRIQNAQRLAFSLAIDPLRMVAPDIAFALGFIVR
jgi:hypothetical protein